MRSSRKPRAYNLIGAGEEPLVETGGQVASSGRSTLSTVFIAIATIAGVLALGVAVPSVVYAVKTWRSQSGQSLRANQLEATQVSVQQSLETTSSLIDARVTVLNSSLTALNQTVLSELMILNEFLNVTSSGNGTFSEILELVVNNVVGGDISMLMAQVNDRIRSINNVPGDATTHNVNLVADTGITVAPGPGAHEVTIGNAGVTSIMASGPGVGVSSATGDVVVSNSGVATINGVPAGSMMAGELTLSTTAMLTLLNDVNASEITIDASAFVTSINNLQNEDATLAMNIMSLQTTNNNLQMQINAIESVGMMLNETGIDLNMTVMELLTKTMMNEERVDQLEQQLANLTSLSLPTGAMIPWAGADTEIPDGYLLCDGTAYNDGDYPVLSGIIGTTYCITPVSMQFCVPNMRGRVPVGLAGGGAFAGMRGSVVGAERVTLTLGEMPVHSHTGTTLNTPHEHEFLILIDNNAGETGNFGNCNFAFNGLGALTCGGPNQLPWFGAGGGRDGRQKMYTGVDEQGNRLSVNGNGDGSHTHSFTTADAGSSQSHANVQPSMLMHYIIKT